LEQNIIGDRIRELRKSKNLTQDDLAVLMNSSRVQINQWETGAREISASRIIEFASALDTSCDFLLRGVTSDKVDSFNQTGLDLHSLTAFSDVMHLHEHKKKQYLYILNSILGSDYFWKSIMPHILAALSIKENSILGGAFSGINNFNPDRMKDKIVESVNTITFSNTCGYTDHIIINKETAISFQLQEASDAFKLLLKAIIDKCKNSHQDPIESITTPYRSPNEPDDKIDILDFIQYLKAMGLTLDNSFIGKENI